MVDPGRRQGPDPSRWCEIDRYQRLRALFEEAVRQDPSTRERYLDQACADDPEFGPELQRLLDAHEKASSFLERPVEPLPTPTIAEEDFSGTDRFTVLRRLGAGGMGVVYEVQDLVRDEIVALKTLRHATPAGVYRLKQEFRSLARVAHPNVVCLYELIVEEARCFFTMELVKGVNFVEYVRAGARASLSIDRLTSALRQLVDGVSALHRLGKLHRDIKPSNVLVTPEGRVVILDFGLITELFRTPRQRARRRRNASVPGAGRRRRHAPFRGRRLVQRRRDAVRSADRRNPFPRSAGRSAPRKRECDPPPPSELAPAVPADFSSICMGLLRRDPARRLSGREAF